MGHLWATSLTANDSSAKEELGIVRIEWSTTDSCWKTYRYGQAADDTTVADGTALGFSDTLGHTISSDCTDYDENQPAGVGIGVITVEYFGWYQIGGYHSAVLTNGDDDIADGDSIVLDDTSDGVVDSVASGTAATEKILGVAVAADVDADNTVAAQLCCNYNATV